LLFQRILSSYTIVPVGQCITDGGTGGKITKNKHKKA